jgi:hypothetical protein
MVENIGIEPMIPACKASVFPLHQFPSPKWRWRDSNPRPNILRLSIYVRVLGLIQAQGCSRPSLATFPSAYTALGEKVLLHTPGAVCHLRRPCGSSWVDDDPQPELQLTLRPEEKRCRL